MKKYKLFLLVLIPILLLFLFPLTTYAKEEPKPTSDENWKLILENLDIDMVIAKGKIVVKDGKASIKATFE